MRRQLLSLPAIVLLYTAAVPFTPVAWVIGEIEGAFLIDRFVAGIILLCALYFQFSISSLTHPIALIFPNPFSQSPEISNGRMRTKQEKAEVVFFYHPTNYYVYVAAEIALLVVAEWGRMEYVRRAIVFGVLAALWAVGWTITPRSTKDWAWGHIKALWFFVVLDVIGSVMRDGAGRRRRR